MFALLNRYDEQSYFDAHRQMYLVTPKGGYVMEIFAALQQSRKNPAVKLLPGSFPGRMTVLILPGLQL